MAIIAIITLISIVSVTSLTSVASLSILVSSIAFLLSGNYLPGFLIFRVVRISDGDALLTSWEPKLFC